MRRQTPLVIGAGPAGCAAAIMLAKAGAQPLILERQRVTGDALCGGFMSWRTLARLESVGVAVETLGGHIVRRVRLFAGERSVTAPLPGRAVGVSRHRLDTLLQARAREAGAAIETQEVRDLATLDAETIFLATGKRDLRGLGRLRSDDDPALGLRLRLASHPTLTALVGDSIELHVFEGGYAGLVLQEDGSANLCMAVRKSRLAATGGTPEALLKMLCTTQPALAARLAHCNALPSTDAIGAVPYGWRAKTTRVGVFRLGDQAAVIPSLAGEGMGIALASGIAAAAAWHCGGAAAAPAFQAAFAARTRHPVATAAWLWRVGERPIMTGVAMAALQLAPRLLPRLAELTRLGD